MFGKRFKRSLPIWSLTLGLSLISGCIIQIGDDVGGPLVPPIPSEFPSEPGELRPPGSSASETLEFIDPLKSFYSVGQTLNLRVKRQISASESRLLNASELVFTTSDDTIASVDVNGVLRFLKPGQISLKVFSKSNPEVKREDIIEVTQQLDVLDISVQPSDDFIELGKTRQLNAVVTLPDGTRNGNVTWSSEDTRIASVSESGELVAHREGVVSIVATYSPNTRYKGRLDLKVVKELPPAPLPTPIVFSPVPTPIPVVVPTPIPTPQPVVSPIMPNPGTAVTLPGDFQGQLVYSSDKDGDQEIYRLTTTGLTQLTQNKSYDATPAISPDGQQIAFVSNQDGNNEIYLMQSDGSNLRRLTRDPGSDQAPDWSPDGSKLVFTSNRGGTEELYIMNTDGSGVVALTQGALAIHPRWSPLGDKITFSSYRDGDTEIYTINSDGKGLKQLTFNSVGDTLPAWAPDGQTILFQSSRNITTGLTLYQIRSDGSSEAQVFQQAGTDAQGVFSPSGQQLAFISQRNGQIDLYLLNLGSGVFSRITQDLASEGHPDWGKL